MNNYKCIKFSLAVLLLPASLCAMKSDPKMESDLDWGQHAIIERPSSLQEKIGVRRAYSQNFPVIISSLSVSPSHPSLTVLGGINIICKCNNWTLTPENRREIESYSAKVPNITGIVLSCLPNGQVSSFKPSFEEK